MNKKIKQKVASLLRIMGFSLSFRIKLYNIIEVTIFFFKKIGRIYLRNNNEFYLSESVVKYVYENRDNYKLLKKKFCFNLDEKSVEIVNRFIERCFHIYTHNLISADMFGEDEILAQKKVNVSKYIKKYPNINFEESCFQYNNGLVYLPENMQKYIINKDCLDIGAFVGDSAVIFSGKYEFRNIYSFEPEKDNFQKLVDNIARYKMSNVVAINCGVGKNAGLGNFSSNGNNSFLIDNHKEEIGVSLIKIDDFVEDKGLNVGVIKMDIEGEEQNALGGAEKTICLYKPVLLIAIYHSGRDFFEIKSIIESYGVDYEFMIRKLNSHHLLAETFLIAFPKNLPNK